MRVISVLNLKGGVAKTFTAANVAYELYRRGYRVLLIDNDKQGNLSKAYSRYDAENIAPVTKLLAGEWDNVDELIQHTDYEGIDIVHKTICKSKSAKNAGFKARKKGEHTQWNGTQQKAPQKKNRKSWI